MLAASVFHFGELRIGDVKDALAERASRSGLSREDAVGVIGAV